MRIALCFSGQPRSLEEGFRFYKDCILDPNESVDVFVHTWHDENLVGEKYDCTAQECRLQSYQEDSISKIVKLYNPVSLKVEKPINFLKAESYAKSHEGWDSSCQEAEPVRANNSFSQFYSVFQSNKLKKEREDQLDFKYDVCIRSRFDYAVSVGFDFSSFDLNKEALYVSDLVTGDNPHFNDQFALGSSEVMDKYSEVYGFCSKFFDESSQRFTVGNESIFYHNAVDKIKVIGHISSNHLFPPSDRGGNSTVHSLLRAPGQPSL